MRTLELVTLGWKHAVGAISENAYLTTGLDATRPLAFYGLVNEHCNLKCQSCSCWRRESYKEEMSIAEWQAVLLSIKSFVGKFSISFCGGEPLLKPGMIDLLAWCGENEIGAGVTTNGWMLTRENAERIVAARPFNVNVSLDAPNPELHDMLRGCTGSFKKATDGVAYLLEERSRQQASFPITIKPTVNAANFRLMPEMVKWVASMGNLCVNPQPMSGWTQEARELLWIRGEEIDELEGVVEELVRMRRAGAPILASELALRLMPEHFRGLRAPRSALPCRVGLRNFNIEPNGDVGVCYGGLPMIGNLRRQSARAIWFSEKARKVRRATVSCDKLCLTTCQSHKTLFNKAEMALRLLRSSRSEKPRPAAL